MAKNRRFQAPNLTFQTTQLTFTPVDIDENMGTTRMYIWREYFEGYKP